MYLISNHTIVRGYGISEHLEDSLAMHKNYIEDSRHDHNTANYMR